MMQVANVLMEQQSKVKPWYAQLWPWLLMAGPFIVVIAACYTGWIAFAKQDALVVDDYYKQGKAINQDLRRDRAATHLGLSAAMRYDPARGELTGKLDAQGVPQSGVLTVHLVHSTIPEKDIKLTVQANSDGVFVATLPMLEMAHWQVMLENEKREWRLKGLWSWPKEQTIQIKAEPAPAE